MPSNSRPTRASRRSLAAASGAVSVVCIMSLRTFLATAPLSILLLTTPVSQEELAGSLAERVAECAAPAEKDAGAARAGWDVDGDGERALDFGSALRRYRLAVGLTQDELAERANVSPRSIGDIERGVSRAPQRNTVGLLAEALGLTGDARCAFEASARRRPAPAPIPSNPAIAARRSTGPEPPAPPLVGRVAEVGLLERHLLADGPPVLVLAGEPGLGKTR